MQPNLFLYGVGPCGSNLYIKKIFEADDYGPINFICVTKQGKEYFMHRVGAERLPQWLLAVPNLSARKNFMQGLITFKEAMSYVDYAAVIAFNGNGYCASDVHDAYSSNHSDDSHAFDNNPWW